MSAEMLEIIKKEGPFENLRRKRCQTKTLMKF